MIDSVVLELNKDQFIIKDPRRFEITRSHGNSGYETKSRRAGKFTETWKERGIYCPSFTLPHRRSGFKEPVDTLEIQYSPPKLIYGTNAFEWDIFEIERNYKGLMFFLDKLGIITTVDELRQTVLRRIDISKTIILAPYFGLADKLIRTLSLFDYKLESDFKYDGYGKGELGASIKFHNTTQGFVVYDKIGEVLNNGYTKQEKWLIEKYQNGTVKRNLMKFELSLQKKNSMEAVLRNRFGTKQKTFTLEEVVSHKKELGDILLGIFDDIYSSTHSGLITLSEMDENGLLDYLYSSGMSQHQVEKLYYWVRMATNFGIAGTWGRLGEVYSGGNVAIVKNKISKAILELGKLDGKTPNLLEFIRAELVKFEMVKPKSDNFFVNHC